MTIFIGESKNEVKVVTYQFMLYQYKSRRQDNIYFAPRYSPSSLELCDHIAQGKTIHASETGLNGTFFYFGFTSDFSFSCNDKVQVTFDRNANESVLIDEVKLLLKIIQDSNWDDSCIVRNAYHEMAATRINKDDKGTIRPKSFVSRAIGLYLWDYCHRHGGLGTRGVQAAALKELKSTAWAKRLQQIGFANSETKVFRDFLKKTDACITAGEVLPF